MHGSSSEDFNSALKSYFDSVRAIGTDIEKYSQARTDCTERKAFFRPK